MIVSFDSRQRVRPEGEGFVQAALDALCTHIAILDERGSILGVNAAWRDFADRYGFDDCRAGLNYLTACERFAQFNPLAAAVSTVDGLRRVIEGHQDVFELEYPCYAPGKNKRRWFVLRVSSFRWRNERRIIVAHQDISELKDARLDLEEGRRQIQAVLYSIPNAVLTVTPAGQIETCNPAAVRIFGYEMSELAGMPIADLMTEPFNNDASFRLLNGEHGHELVGKRCDDSRFPMYFGLSRMKLDDSCLYIVTIQDMTERKRMEAELLEKERMRVALQKERELRELKNRFLSMMSHELRTPLASIRLSCDMLAQYGDRATDEEKAQYLDNIRVQVEHLNEMVSDVMSLSKSERSEQGFHPEHTDLITFCRSIVEAFQINPRQTRHIAFDCPHIAVTAEFDKELLWRALINLIGNAIKYSAAGSSVDFRLWREGGCAFIQVQDSGIGIPPQDADYLFDAFHRGTNVAGRPGTGLGLAIARQAVDLHDGDISFQSEPGAGTTFTVRLPLLVAEEVGTG